MPSKSGVVAKRWGHRAHHVAVQLCKADGRARTQLVADGVVDRLPHRQRLLQGLAHLTTSAHRLSGRLRPAVAVHLRRDQFGKHDAEGTLAV